MSNEQNYSRKGFLGWMNVLKWEGMREVDRQNEKRVNILAMGWALTIIGVSALVTFLELPLWQGLLLAIVPVTFGILTMRAYLRLLREADEMLRQMQLEAMAVGFGTGLIIGNTLVFLDFPSEWIAPAIVAPMAIAFTIRVMLAARTLAGDANASAMEEAGE